MMGTRRRRLPPPGEGGDGVRAKGPRAGQQRGPLRSLRCRLLAPGGYRCQGPNACQGIAPASLTVQYSAITTAVYVPVR